MEWMATKRKQHGESGVVSVRWVVHRAGDLRGICECWEESAALLIAGALNGLEANTPAEASNFNSEGRS